jgi:PucR C-terminal helix-turn-helix domain/GGDEF-like domain
VRDLPIVECDTVSDWQALVDLDEVVEILGADIERPVVLYDAALRLLAFSTHESDVDEARRAVILSRRASARATEMINASGASRSREPVRIPVDQVTGTPGRVVYAVRWRDQIVGYLVYVDEHPNEPLPQYHAQVLYAFGEHLSQLLHDREQVRRQEEEQVLDLLRQLISANADDRAKAAAEAVHSGRLSASGSTVALALTTRAALGGGPLPAGELARLEEALTEVLRLAPSGAIGAVLGDHAVAIQTRPLDLGRLRRRARSRGDVGVGVGDPRPSLAAVSESYREAVICSRATWLDPGQYAGMAAWADLGTDRLLLQLPLSQLTEADLPAGVRRLLAVGSGPNLAATLECYLDAGCDAQATARVLMIHRSSLYYRLGRIREIIEVDLADGRVRRDLHIGLRAASLCGMRTRERS